MNDSFLAEGFILEKTISTGCAKRSVNPKVLVANSPMDFDKVKIHGSKVKVDSMMKVAEIEEAEREKMKRKIDRILAHKPDVFINRQLIYDYPEQLLADAGVIVIEHADFDGTERLAAVLGGEIISTFDSPETAKLGSCDLIEEIMIGEDKVIAFKGCAAGTACSVVLRGSGQHILDEAERSLHDALCVLTQTVRSQKAVLGGGNTEIQMAIAVEDLAKKTSGKEALAIEAFSKALRALPTIICDNAGFDSSEIVQNLVSDIYTGKTDYGLNMTDGTVDNMREAGITECLKVKESALKASAEAAEMILRVDEIIRCAPRQREG